MFPEYVLFDQFWDTFLGSSWGLQHLLVDPSGGWRYLKYLKLILNHQLAVGAKSPAIKIEKTGAHLWVSAVVALFIGHFDVKASHFYLGR